MGCRNTDMSYQIQHDKSTTAKSIAFSLPYSHFISHSGSALNDWSVVKSNGTKVAAKIDQFFAENCCSLQSPSWISSKLLNQNHNLWPFKETALIKISSTQLCHSYSVVWVFCLVQSHVKWQCIFLIFPFFLILIRSKISK
jgi:hypothetical protein